MPHPVDDLQTFQAWILNVMDKDTWTMLRCTLLLLWIWDLNRPRAARCTAVNACALGT